MKEIKLTIIHFHPIEKYPPLQNLINYITEHRKNIFVNLITTTEQKATYTYTNSQAVIKRINIVQGNSLFTLFSFLKFTMVTLFDLIFNKPDKLIYYESVSSFPVFIYTLLNRKIDVYIHYHEYTTKDQYKKEMRVIYFSHLFEKYLYKKAKWISHTNKKRLELFAKDNGLDIKDKRLNVLPNYPPKAWQYYAIREKIIDPQHIRLVYIGSLSMVNMYTKELFDWIVLQNGKITLDIYSNNLRSDVTKYYVQIKSKHINLHEGLPYHDLPNLLKAYDIGIIIYKKFTLNYIYNAPNKLFEYSACNLDVWFSEDMIGSYTYIKEESLPKVIKVNFKDLDNFDIENAIDHRNLLYRENLYYCETVYDNFVDYIIN